ncbi:MAG: hypothetical protein ACFFBD_07275 [Candidatus Hodarchaeota archaeon]
MRPVEANNHKRDRQDCTLKMLPKDCLFYQEDFGSSCPIMCIIYRPGTPIIPALYPKLKIDCQYLDRFGDQFVCREQKRWLIEEEIDCQRCGAYERQKSIKSV